MKNLQKILWALLCIFDTINAKITFTADTTITGSAFDKRTGKWYLALARNENKTIISVGPSDGSNTLSTTNLTEANDIPINQNIGGMTLGYRSEGTPYLAYFKTNALVLYIKDISSGDEHKNDFNLRLQGGGALGAVRAVTATNALRKINDNTDYNFIFSLVSSSNQPFMDNASGIGITKLTETSTIENLGTFGFTASSAWTKGTRNGITAASSGGCIIWNNDLQRLFVGVSGTSANDEGSNTIITLSCFKLNDDFTGLQNIQMNTNLDGYDTAATNATSSIVGASSFDAVTLSIRHLSIMHTSTNHYYAIINGGRGSLTATAAKILAVPLVGPEGDIPGSLATVYNRTKALIDFNARASSAAELFHETDAPVLVGTTSLPCPDGAGLNQELFDGVETNLLIRKMEAVGDTVYCALGGINDGDNQPGLYYSQAIFNNYGAIIGWTEWALAVPAHISGDANDKAACFTFAIDAARGKIFAIPDTARNTIKLTTWTHQTDPETFAGQVNNILDGPCYSSLILDQYAENIGNKVRGRFALFGGMGKVVAIRTGFGSSASYSAANKPTTVWDDTTVAAVNLSEGLPSTPINCLGYSYLPEDDADRRNFFLAGTDLGLYIYTLKDTDLSGFAIDAANILSAMDNDQCIFTRGKWTNFAITEPVLKITTTTPGLISLLVKGADGHYVAEISIGGSLTGNTGDEFLFDRYLYEQDTLNDYGITDMYDILAVKKNNNSTLLTATNQGIIGSRLPLSLAHKTILHHFSTPQRTRGNSMFWFAKRSNDVTTGNIIQKTRLYQATVDYINTDDLRTTNTNPISLVPAHPITTDIHTFTLANDGDADRHSNLHILDSLTTPIYNNGSLRLFAVRTQDVDNKIYSKLCALPYRTHNLEYNVTSLTPINDEGLKDVTSINWINNVGAGYTMIGTNIGLVSLE